MQLSVSSFIGLEFRLDELRREIGVRETCSNEVELLGDAQRQYNARNMVEVRTPSSIRLHCVRRLGVGFTDRVAGKIQRPAPTGVTLRAE